jgi:L-aspartate oxidase
VFGSRAASAAVREPAPDRRSLAEALATSVGRPVPSAESRAALWRFAGIERDGDGLRALAEDPHPLVRLIARSALARTESRGAHQRRDYPSRDPAFDGRHVTTRGGEPELEHWS